MYINVVDLQIFKYNFNFTYKYAQELLIHHINNVSKTIAMHIDAFLTITILVSFEPSVDFSQILWCEPDAVPYSGMSQYLLEAR